MTKIVARVSPRQWAGLIIAILAIVFVLMNRGEIPINLFGVQVTGPAWVLLLLVFLVGWLVGVLTNRRSRK
ncbi:hypothetical protein [Dietzia sp. ANT_WB102]|uniref:hypothetical protein n=1 Tax=Dietzia sp. ANT_WB102 TaxID=2597345 RepID=UPI0011ED6287|nr:hypothetical protein [Dietzia sp. ANT_WB102]KAA0918000.1 hypothetical protein FQ137_00920 [Dietzia sp. ANT_WB102]